MQFTQAEPVFVLTGTDVVDPYSDDVTLSWDSVTTYEERAAVAPKYSVEPTEVDRSPIDSGFDLVFDHEPIVSSRNRVIVRGLTCLVDGRPTHWVSPWSGWDAGWVLRVTVREG